MPSGGGSAGGGGGGGGGGGFGGGYGGDSWSTGWRSRGYSFRNRSYGTSSDSCDDCTCGMPTCSFPVLVVVGVVLVTLLVIGLSVGLGVRARNTPKSDIATDFYSPGDSRLISLSSFFCDSVRFSVESEATGAAFFLVDSAPPLTDQNNFTINSDSTLDQNGYHFWQYHLYPNSRASIDVCTDCSRVFLDIYVIKGNTNFNKWGDGPGEDHARLFQQVSTLCPMKIPLPYIVDEEDEYYFIVHNSFDRIALYYNMTLTIDRFEYQSPPIEVNSTVVDHCIISSSGNCAVDIPYGTGSQLALVVTDIPENVDWGENVDVKTSCSRRHWAYAVVVLVPLFVVTVVILIIVLLVIHYCCCDWSKTKTVASDNVDDVDNIDGVAKSDVDNVDKIDT